MSSPLIGGMAAAVSARRPLHSARAPRTPQQQAALRHFTLHYGQTQAWQALHHEKYRIVSVFAGTGGGKTYGGPRLFYPFFAAPGGLEKTYLWTEPTWRMLKRIMLPIVVPFLDAFGLGEMHYGDMVYELKKGGIIYFGSVDNPNSLQGVHISGGVWADEIGLYSEEAWDVLLQRAAFYQAPILNTSTPYTLPWVERRLAKPATDPVEGQTYRCIQYASWVNPAYPLDEYWRFKRTWPADKFERLLGGQFTQIGGLMFEEFNAERNLAYIYPIDAADGSGQPTLYMKHPREGEREIPLTRVWGAQDWGWSPDPGCALLMGADAYGRTYVFDERYETHIPVERGTDEGEDTWANRALSWCETYWMDHLYCDPSSPADIASMVSHRVPALKAINDIAYGADLVNQALMARDDGSCGLYIAQNACPNLVRTIGTYVRAKDPRADDRYLPKPAPNQEDHACDTLRYGIVQDSKRYETSTPADLPPVIRGARRKQPTSSTSPRRR